jgi:hypothetical protein
MAWSLDYSCDRPGARPCLDWMFTGNGVPDNVRDHWGAATQAHDGKKAREAQAVQAAAQMMADAPPPPPPGAPQLALGAPGLERRPPPPPVPLGVFNAASYEDLLRQVRELTNRIQQLEDKVVHLPDP